MSAEFDYTAERRERDYNSDEELDDEEMYGDVTEGKEEDLNEEIPQEEVEVETRVPLVQKLLKIIDSEKKERLKMEIALQSDAKKLDGAEKRFNIYVTDKNYDVGNMVRYRAPDSNGKLIIFEGLIVGFEKDHIRVVSKSEGDVSKASKISYEAIIEAFPRGEDIKPVEKTYNAKGEEVDWEDFTITELVEFMRELALKEYEIKDQRKKAIVLRTDEINLMDVYGTKPDRNPFHPGFDVGKRVRYEYLENIITARIIDYSNNSVTIKSVRGDPIEIKDLSLLTFVEDSIRDYPTINRTTLLNTLMSERKTESRLESFDLISTVKGIVLGKWQDLCSSLFPQDPRRIILANRENFVDLDDEDLYNSGSDFETWVILTRKNDLDKMYFELNKKNLFEMVKDIENKFVDQKTVLGERSKKLLMTVFERKYSEDNQFVDDFMKILDKIGSEGPEGLNTLSNLKQRFEEEFSQEMEKIMDSGRVYPHQYSESLMKNIPEYEFLARNPNPVEGDYQIWLEQNQDFVERIREDINRMFVRERLVQKYRQYLDKVPILYPTTFNEEVSKERLVFIRWIYRNTVGAIESLPKYKKFREGGEQISTRREEKIWARYYQSLISEYALSLPPSPFTNHTVVRDIETLIENAGRESYTLGDFLRRTLSLFVLLSPPFSRKISKYLVDRLVGGSDTVANLSSILSSRNKELNFGSVFPEIANHVNPNMRKIFVFLFEAYLEQAFDQVLFDIPYYRFSRPSKIGYVHSSALVRLESAYSDPVDRCIVETNTGVEPTPGKEHQMWTDEYEDQGLQKIDPKHILLCIHDGKFYCYKEKDLVVQFLKKDYISKYTGGMFGKDYVEAVLAPYKNKMAHFDLSPTPSAGVIGATLKDTAALMGVDINTLTTNFNSTNLSEHIIYVNGFDEVGILKTRLPPTKKTVYFHNMTVAEYTAAKKMAQSLLRGKVDIKISNLSKGKK